MRCEEYTRLWTEFDKAERLLKTKLDEKDVSSQELDSAMQTQIKTMQALRKHVLEHKCQER